MKRVILAVLVVSLIVVLSSCINKVTEVKEIKIPEVIRPEEAAKNTTPQNITPLPSTPNVTQQCKACEYRENNTCLKYSCCNDADCNDNNATTLDICTAPTTQQAVCNHNVSLCSDGSADSACSTTLPFMCSKGELIPQCSKCGCPTAMDCSLNGTCVYRLSSIVEPKVTLTKSYRHSPLNVADNQSIDSFYLMKDKEEYKMWYAFEGSIYATTSTNGITWEAAERILRPDDEISYITEPTVIKEGSTYKMWFTDITDTVGRIGLATSANGRAWDFTRENPVFTPDNNTDDTSEPGVRDPSVIKENDLYKMWYTHGEEVYYATSTNGINWTVYGKVFEGNMSYDQYGIKDAVVIKDQLYEMVYVADSGDERGEHDYLAHAYSPDGITWIKHSANPFIRIGKEGKFDEKGLSEPVLLKNKNNYTLWYAGIDAQKNRRIGMAMS